MSDLLFIDVSLQDGVYKELPRPSNMPHPPESTRDPIPPSIVWAEHFKPRLPVESVRNCSQVDRSVQEQIVDVIASDLLGQRSCWIEVDTLESERAIGEGGDMSGLMWNRGGERERERECTL